MKIQISIALTALSLQMLILPAASEALAGCGPECIQLPPPSDPCLKKCFYEDHSDEFCAERCKAPRWTSAHAAVWPVCDDQGQIVCYAGTTRCKAYQDAHPTEPLHLCDYIDGDEPPPSSIPEPSLVPITRAELRPLAF